MQSYDARRNIEIPGDKDQTIRYCVQHFIRVANESIIKKGHFFVALSGGNTPKAIYEELSRPENASKIDWKLVSLFWSDARCVPPTHSDCNYKMAMDSGFAKLAIPQNQIFRMKGEQPPQEAGEEYDAIIRKHVPNCSFDLMMLGMGEDGHTASLFPFTKALHVKDREATANFVPQKQAWRLTVTFECINRSKNSVIYVLGASKADTIHRVLIGPNKPDELPIQRVGTAEHKALWIMDDQAAVGLKSR